MSGGGSNSPTATPYYVDRTQLAAYMQTESGKKYANMYNPNVSYAEMGSGNYIALNNDSGPFGNGKPFAINEGYSNVTPLLSAFNEWTRGSQQQMASWENYAASVAANEGGQGDNTITQGEAVGQRQQLLGALANAGNPINPTPSLGSFGTLTANGKPVGASK